jgi:plasmid stabilization system protein ParE
MTAQRLAIRPQAAQDIEDQAWYLTQNASEAVALRFHQMVEETFA